jgi:nucleotide-binding universal stress UspA family protein
MDSHVTSFSNILVAVDGSESSQRAARVAIELAKTFGADLTVLHIMEVPAIPYMSDRPVEVDVKELDEAARSDGVRMVSKAASLADTKGVDAKEKVIRRMGSAAEGITDYAKKNGIDLIVVGTRGMSSIRKLLMGSVASGVVGSADCSVLVVR